MIKLTEHLIRYPKMQLQDILKLHLQGILGPMHLGVDEETLRKNLTQEYQDAMQTAYEYEMIEELSDSYVRVYLKPYFDKFKTFDYLIHAFILSATPGNDEECKKNFIKEVKKLITDENKEKICKYIDSHKWSISHSDIYKSNYFPHYLVVNKKYIKECLNEK